MSDTIYRTDAIEVVHKHFIDALDDFPTVTDEDGYVIIKDTKSVNKLLKHNKAISKALKALPSAEVVSHTSKGICAVCANKQVCEDAKRNLDMIECSRFELDTHYHVSTDAVLQLNRIDTLIIANALRYLINDEEQHELNRATAESLRERILKYGASMCKGGDDE